MKLSALNAPGLIKDQYGPGKGNYKLIDLQDDYHITIFPNQDTYDQFPDLSKQPQNSLVLNLPPINSFELDELHVTHVQDGRHDHFFYDANGKPLERPMSKYAKGGHSVDFNDARWYHTNQIVADLLGVSVDSINAHWNVPEKAPSIDENKAKTVKNNQKPGNEIVLSSEIRKQMEVAEKRRAATASKQEQETSALPVKFSMGLAKPSTKNTKKPIIFNFGGTQPTKETPEASGTIESDEERGRKRGREDDE